MYEKILVPVDGSDASTEGLNEALKIAKSQGSTLRLVHVINELILESIYRSGVYAADLVDSLRETGRSIMDLAEAVARRQNVIVECVLLESIGGTAADLILAQAEEWPADLIVMGTHGRRGLRRLAMGSDAEEVVRGASVPVLVVRGTSKRMANVAEPASANADAARPLVGAKAVS